MKKNKTFHKKKIWVIFLCCSAMLAGLFGRLIYLMGFRSDYYYEKAEIFMKGSGILRRQEEKFWTQREKFWPPIKQSVRSQ